MKDIERIKRIPLANWCIEHLGYIPNKAHDSKLWRSLISPKGEKIITKDVPNEQGHYLFKCQTQEASGSIIDLLINLEGYDLRGALDLFIGVTLPLPSSSTPFVKVEKENKDNTLEVSRVFRKQSAMNVMYPNYLSSRGISKSTIEYFGLSPLLDSITIPLYRRSKGRWVAQTSIRYYFDQERVRYRLFQKGLSKKGAYSILKEKARSITSFSTVAFFESPIDAISHAQLRNYPDVLYMSTCGSISHDFLFFLPSDLHSLSVSKVLLCFDNDVAGQAMTTNLSAHLRSHSIPFSIDIPLKKDWNEDLTNLILSH